VIFDQARAGRPCHNRLVHHLAYNGALALKPIPVPFASVVEIIK